MTRERYGDALTRAQAHQDLALGGVECIARRPGWCRVAVGIGKRVIATAALLALMLAVAGAVGALGGRR